jgi:hypothetical protein
MYGSTASCSSRCRSPRTSSFAAAAAAVWFAGTRLARHTDAIAQTTGIGREFLGMVLLGGVTSPATVRARRRFPSMTPWAAPPRTASSELCT